MGNSLQQSPSRDVLSDILKDLSASLFPTHYGQSELGREQVYRSLLFSGDTRSHSEVHQNAAAIVSGFASELPSIRGLLVGDVQAAFRGDPAAGDLYEILLGYPGMTAIIHQRLAHSLYLRGAPLIARLIAGIAHSKTGIDIHPGAEIGRSFFIDHGTGVVIGETAIIGQRVRIYQAVTLGARSFAADENGALIKGNARHPIIEDDVVIYAGATILGRVTVGCSSVIGGNVWLSHSVPPNSRISQAKFREEKHAN